MTIATIIFVVSQVPTLRCLTDLPELPGSLLTTPARINPVVWHSIGTFSRLTATRVAEKKWPFEWFFYGETGMFFIQFRLADWRA